MIEIFKDGDTNAIRTDASDERYFIEEVSELLSDLVEKGEYSGDWEFQFSHWLPLIVNICCKFRGYKNDVHEIRTLVAGEVLMIGMDEPTHKLSVKPKTETAGELSKEDL